MPEKAGFCPFVSVRSLVALGHLVLAVAVHEGAQRVAGAHALLDDGVHRLHDGHFHVVLGSELHGGGQGVDALHHHAHFLHGLLRAFALADEDAGAVVAAVHTGGRHDQITDAGQACKGVDVAAHGHATKNRRCGLIMTEKTPFVYDFNEKFNCLYIIIT